MIDEKASTDIWLTSAYESFDYNVEKGDYQSCLALIHDMSSHGYVKEAHTLRELLRAVPLERFTHQSPIQRYDL